MGSLPKEDRAGLWITLIVHLSILIVLLIAQIDSSKQKDSSFVLDFTKQEEVERQQKEAEELMEKIARAEQMRAELQQKIDREIGTKNDRAIKNVVTDRGGNLLDDRNTDVEELQRYANEVQSKLGKGYDIHKISGPGDVSTGDEGGDDEPAAKKSYSGASVLSWQLDGRRAVNLPVPAYKCYGGGTVTVIITVNRAGKVLDATVQSGSSDGCLRSAAVAAAKRSRFNADDSAPEKQVGNIIYEFIAQ